MKLPYQKVQESLTDEQDQFLRMHFHTARAAVGNAWYDRVKWLLDWFFKTYPDFPHSRTALYKWCDCCLRELHPE